MNPAHKQLSLNRGASRKQIPISFIKVFPTKETIEIEN